MPSPQTAYIVEYVVVAGADQAALAAAVNAKIALNANWQPWGSLVITAGGGDTHHQAMVRYGAQLNIPTGGQ